MYLNTIKSTQNVTEYCNGIACISLLPVSAPVYILYAKSAESTLYYLVIATNARGGHYINWVYW
jgi:hypothetical protein